MKIGQLAKLAGVSVDTIRYYERRGLLAPPARTSSGYRCYTPDELRRLTFIVRAKRLGFTLEETRQLLTLGSDDHACATVRKRARRKAEDIRIRIQQLTRIRQTLLALAEQCAQTAPHETCPMLQALEDEDGQASHRPTPRRMK